MLVLFACFLYGYNVFFLLLCDFPPHKLKFAPYYIRAIIIFAVLKVKTFALLHLLLIVYILLLNH